MTPATSAQLVRDGLVSDLSTLAVVTESTSGYYGGRVIDVRLSGGLSFEVLPDRGLDIGTLWWEGKPVAWRSAMAGGAVSTDGKQNSWSDRWRGGMLTTCGPDNIGVPRDGYGQHGSWHSTPATDVAVARELTDDAIVVTITGRIRTVELFGRRVTIERTITASTDSPTISVVDRIANVGVVSAPVPVLYHLNFGAPFLGVDTTIHYDGDSVDPRDDEAKDVPPDRMPAPASVMDEAVFEHVFAGAAPTQRVAVAETPSENARATVTWDSSTLPRAFEWIWPAKGSWVLGIEPANAPMWGEARQGPNAGAPVLEPGESFTTRVSIAFERLTGD